MQNLFGEVASLDQRCYQDFHLSEEILMEHAADGMADYIHKHYGDKSTITIVCGGGNNGADGVVLARLLHKDFDVSLYLASDRHSAMTTLQLQRAEAIGITLVDTLQPCDILVDALFGSGFSRSFDDQTKKLLTDMNARNAIKIACDMPSGLHLNGQCEVASFVADITLTMGALKQGMFSDHAKAFVGTIYVIDLGISRKVYEKEADWKLLDESDLKLPHRDAKNSHKGSYGHLAVVCGEKLGASVMCGSAALRFGTGLVTLISNNNEQIPYELMQSHLLPETTTALALGMGLGREFSNQELLSLLDNTLPLLLDADIFAHPLFLSLLKRKGLILTPHPKEFVTILKVTGLADITVTELQEQRFEWVTRFSEVYPQITLVLKGANVIIAHSSHYYINPHGTNILAKGGSGDVLAGIIAALMAQGHTPLEAAIQGSLAHTTAAKSLNINNYALTPNHLIEALATL